MPYPPFEVDVMLEYRVAVLEGVVDWLLKNGIFTKSLDGDEMKQIHEKAVQLVNRAYPNTEIEFKGAWPR